MMPLSDFAARRRSTLRLFGALALLSLVLVGFNGLIARTARSSYRRQMLTRLDHLSPQADCIFLGNSLVEAGCDVAAFSSALPPNAGRLSPVNLALGATSPVEHYLILSRALQHPLHLKYLIYGFFDDQLLTPARAQWADLVGNRALDYYFPAQAASFYAPGSRLETWELRLTGDVPMLADRSSYWGKVELLRRVVEDVGMPGHKSNRFGRVEDFAALEAKDLPSFVQRCATGRELEAFSAPIREIIRLGATSGAKVVLVEMPMPSRHRQIFYSSPAWAELRAHAQSLARREHAVYLTADDWVADDRAFEDATHLSQEGAKIFSRQLAQAITSLP